jgi:hypothetical protein
MVPPLYAEAWRDWLCGREACPLRWMDGRALLSKEPQPEKEGGALHIIYKVLFHLGLLPLKTDVNVPTVSNKQKNLPVEEKKTFSLLAS